ncbi:MAG: MerR family DNA-binding protein [Paracoccaceae bacterium]|nr:MerR family DNA-binding protein [Paracoccaceae bacterium]
MKNIGQAAKEASLSVKAVRYYHYIKLVSTSLISRAGYRQYDDGAIARGAFISKTRKFSFSINDCRHLISLYENKERPSREVKKIALRKLQDIDLRMTELKNLQLRLGKLAAACKGDYTPNCPIIGSLANKLSKNLSV